jgi:hypothetical protein
VGSCGAVSCASNGPAATPLSVGLPVTGSPFGGAGSAVTLLPGAVVGGVTVGWVKTGAVTTTLNRAAEVNNVFRMCITSQIEPWATGLLFPAIQYPCWGCYGRAGIVKVAERPGEIDRARAAQQLRKCICSTQIKPTLMDGWRVF